MGSRTTLDEQITALARLASKNEGRALRDAIHTLAQLKKIQQEIRTQKPDADRVADIMVELVDGS